MSLRIAPISGSSWVMLAIIGLCLTLMVWQGILCEGHTQADYDSWTEDMGVPRPVVKEVCD